jgi:hypothetical protein
MKEVKIDPAIRQDPGLYNSVKSVTELLEQEIGPKASEITADWSLARSLQPGERLINLEISDELDRASCVFSEIGLPRISENRLRISLIRLWGDLLQEQSHRDLAELRLIVQGLEP